MPLFSPGCWRKSPSWSPCPHLPPSTHVAARALFLKYKHTCACFLLKLSVALSHLWVITSQRDPSEPGLCSPFRSLTALLDETTGNKTEIEPSEYSKLGRTCAPCSTPLVPAIHLRATLPTAVGGCFQCEGTVQGAGGWASSCLNSEQPAQSLGYRRAWVQGMLAAWNSSNRAVPF